MNAEFIKPSTSYKRKMYAALFTIFLIALTGGTVFQLIKISLFPSIDLRISNMITVVFGTLVSVIVRDYPLTIKSKAGRLTDVLFNMSVYKNEAGEVGKGAVFSFTLPW